MTGEHAELTAELRALAETVLERLGPVLQKAAAPRPEGAVGDPAPCPSCSWCPLCALAALIRGEQHDLVTLLAGQASTLLAVLREALDNHEWAPASPGTEPDPAGGTSSFVPIDVTIKN
ncbi:hypothetical protein [Rhodococcus sp. ABRD24]|uniref:hypothetical protein n=1 Tax=Rhodococcus sp. ABRD24 TaxID=2507582 RepID=UPI0013F1614C|nr:hypothetical protein [Rhodococcus sp. ABRD24]